MNPVTIRGVTYPSRTAAAKVLNLDRRTILRAIQSEKTTSVGLSHDERFTREDDEKVLKLMNFYTRYSLRTVSAYAKLSPSGMKQVFDKIVKADSLEEGYNTRNQYGFNQ